MFHRFFFSFVLKRLNVSLYVVHYAVPDDISAHLHQESSLEFQAQAERGTTSEDARFSRE